MRLTRILILLLLWSFSHIVAATPSDRLFDPGATPDQAQLPAHALAAQSSFVKINRGLLGHESFVLELFDGDYVAIRDRLDRSKQGSFVWVGHLQGEQGSQVVFAFHRNHVSGFINKGDETIELGTNRNGKLMLYRVDKGALPEMEPDVMPESALAAPGGEGDFETFSGALDEAIKQDLLLVYTQSACDQRGSCDSLEADLLAAIADTNQAYVNSGVGIALNIAGMELVNYDESDIVESLQHLTWSQGHTDDPDGALDEVHNLRNQTSADLVVLVSDDSNYCGIGWVNSNQDTAFSVVKWSCLSNRSLTHELGHNQGSAHNRENASVAGRYSYSYGHRVCEGNNGFRTVMSYSSDCDFPRINHFSSPDINFKGQSTGVSEIEFPTTAANNALSLNATAAVVASFRLDPNLPLGVFNPGNQQNMIGEVIALQIETSNSNGQPVVFSALGLPAGLIIDPVSGLVSGTLNSDAVDHYTIAIFASFGSLKAGIQFNWRVTDLDGNGGESALEEVGCLYDDGETVIPIEPPDPCEPPIAPQLTDPGDQTSVVGDFVLLPITAYDGNGDFLSFSATGLPAGLSMNFLSGLISGTVNGAPGSYPVTLTVVDSTFLQDQVSFNWQVLSAPSSTPPVITDPGQQTNQVGDAVSLQVLASDANGDTLTYSASGLPASLSINSVTGLISGTANDVPGSYPVILTVVDSTSLQSQLSFGWDIISLPVAPVIADPGLQTNIKNETISLQVVASDANGDTLTYSASGLPNDLLIDPVTGLISGKIKANQVGTHQVTLTVLDGTGLQDQLNFTWQVNATASSSAPVITNPGQQTNQVGDAVSLQILASDADGDTLTYSASGLPASLSINSTTGLISGTVTDALGTYSVTLTVVDSTALQSQLGFNWEVVSTPVAPVITNPGQQTSEQGDAVSLQVVASDGNGDTLTYSASGLPASLSINSTTGLISGTVTDALGTYSVTLTVVDSTALQSQLGFNWEVVSTPVAPVITNPGQQTSEQGDAVSLQVVASDGNGDTLTYSASGLPASLSINSTTGLISGTVTDALGTYSVTLTVVDSTALQSQLGFNWEVVSTPVAPVITNPGQQTSEQGDAVSLQVVASDGNGDTLTYSASGLPASLSMNSVTGLISGTITDSLGTYLVTLTVVDTTSLQSQVSFNWEVLSAPVAPVIADPGSQTNQVDDSVSLQVLASDGNGDTLTYSASGLPASLSINSVTGLISGTIGDTLGTYLVTLTVVDSTSLQSQVSFNWEVLSGPAAPVITDPGQQSNIVDEVVSLQIVATDANGDTLSYSASGLPASLSINTTTGLISGTVNDAVGTYVVTLTVVDSTSLQSQLSFNWEVVLAPVAPVITDPGQQTNQQGDTVSLQVVASDGNGDTLTYAASGLAASLSMNTTTGLISGTLTDALGDYLVTVTVVDSTSLQNQVSFNWEVLSGPAAPVIADPGQQSNIVDEVVSLQIVATDANGDTLSYSASGLPASLSINTTTGLISGTVNDAVGTYVVTLTVVDSTSLQSQLSFNWEVVLAPVAPVITDPGQQTNQQGDTVSLQVVASDGNGDTLTYAASGLAASLSMNTTTGLISGTLTDALGDYLVTVTVVDSTSLQNQVSFNWEVLSGPAAPVITDPGQQSNIVDEVVSLPIVATDANGDTLSYSASGLPASLSINLTTGLISGTVNDAVGTYAVTLTVVDSTSLQSQLNFNWQVNIDPVAPVITNPGQQVSLLGDTVALQVVATDGNEDTLTYSASGLPGGLTIDPNTGLISGTVNAGLGAGTVTLTVADTTALQSQSSFSWEIFDLTAVTDLSHIWNDETNRLFKLAWRYSETAMVDTYRTPAYFKVSPGLAQPAGTMMPLDVAIDANVGNRMWQSFELDGFYYLGGTYWVSACVGDDQCGPFVAVNLQTAQSGSDLESVDQLDYTWVDEAAGTFVLNWTYDADYFASTTGKPNHFEIIPSLDLAASPIIVPTGNPAPLSWQSLTIDDDNYLGSSYVVKACPSTGDCGPSRIMALSRQLPEPDFPIPVWNHGNSTVDSSLQFTLDWQSSADARVDYFSIEEQGPIGTSVFYTEADSIAMERAASGTYSFRIKACDRDRENGDRCGTYSSAVSVTVPAFAQMSPVSNLGWYWANQSNNEIRLNWKYPSSAYNASISRPDYFAVSFSGGLWYISFNHSVDASNGDGDYTWVSNTMPLDAVWQSGNFSVRACVNGGLCGDPVTINPWTDPVSPALDQDYATQSNNWDNPVAAPDPVPGGPDDMKPGTWWDPDRAGTGWDFFWASELRYPALHESYGETYDLIAFWYAYQEFPGENGNSIWLPVWFYSLLKLEQGGTHYTGTLFFPTHTTGGENCDAADSCAVGKVDVFIDQTTNTAANVSVMINKSAGLDGITDTDFDLTYIGDDTDIFGDNSTSVENPHDHFSGMWGPSGALQDEFATLHWMEGWFESLTIVHYDQNGVPIWTRAQLDGRPENYRDGSPAMTGSKPLEAVNRINDERVAFPGATNYSVYTVDLGFNPTKLTPQGYNVGNHTVSAGSGGRLFEDHNVSADVYEGYRKAGVWLNLDYTVGSGAGTRIVDLLVGTSSSPVEMRKLTNFHDIRFFVGDDQTETSECPLSAASGTCDLHLNWFTDSEYPAVTAFLHNLDNGQYTKIASPGEGVASYPTTIDYPYSISELGNYQLELWKYPNMVNGAPDLELQGNAQIAISGNLAVTAAVIVPPGTPEIPPDPDVGPDPSSVDGSSEIGATTGQFRVDESGNANYSIPIMTAPGSGGVAPQISLNYSSQSGNGPLGVGWSLGGLSAITRCAQTKEQDTDALGNEPTVRNLTLTDSDRFCLDGQRLVMVAGSAYGAHGAEYRTEIDGVARITSYEVAGTTGPAWFKVERKDGSISEYGKSQDSRIEARTVDYPDTAIVWAQNRFTDSAKNYFSYAYDEHSSGPVEFVIDKIEYTGNSEELTDTYAELDFVYQIEVEPGYVGRLDASNSYLAGAELSQTKLLASIHSRSSVVEGGALTDLRYYELNYATDGFGRNILNKLEECRNGSKLTCYAPTTFTWLKSLHEFEETRTSNSNTTVLPQSETIYGMQLADVNGDARPEVLYTTLNDSDNEFYFKIKSPQANGQFNNLGLSNGYLLPKKNSTPPRLFAIDLNADSFQDVIYRKHISNDTFSWKRRLSTGSSFSSEADLSTSAWDFVLDETDPKTSTRISVVDFNGDGLSDLLNNKTERLSGDNKLLFEVALNTGDANGYLASPVEYTVEFDTSFIPTALPGGWEVFNENVFAARTPEGELLKNKVFDYDGDGDVDLLRLVWRQFRRDDGPALDPLPGEPDEEPDYSYSMVSFWVIISSTDTASLDYQVVAKGMGCNFFNACLETQYADLPLTDNMVPVDINADGLADLAYSNGHKSGTNQWYYMLNTGAGFTAPIELTGTTTETALPAYADEQVRFEDMDGNGYPDLVYPADTMKQLAKWEVLFNDFGNGFSSTTSTTLRAGHVGEDSGGVSKENDATIFADFTGNGKLDHLFLNFNEFAKITTSNTDSGLYKGGNFVTPNFGIEPSNVITGIKNGLGAITTLDYLPLTDSNVYTRALDAPQATNWGKKSIVYDLIAPIYVVSQATSSAPVFGVSSATSNVEYHYVGAKMQGGGRGFLGFGEVISYDPQSSIRTNTRYRQDYPFIGMPADTMQSTASLSTKFLTLSATTNNNLPIWSSVVATTDALPSLHIDDTRVSYAINEWKTLTTAGNALLPYLANSLERSYSLTGDFDRKVLTNSSYDTYGNLTNSSVATYATDDSSVFASQSTINTYADVIESNKWFLGRLQNSKVTHSRLGLDDIERESSFSYDPGTGILVEEKIEPNKPTYRVTTSYQLDNFGNRVQTTVTGNGVPARTASVTYDSLGRFPTQSQNALGQITQTINSWDVFGNPLQVANIDGVISTSATDLMGRPFVSYTETGVWSKSINTAGSGSYCPSGTVFHTTTTAGGAPTQVQCFDVLGRAMRTAVQTLSGSYAYTDQYYDSSGRVERVSEPYFTSAPDWNETGYDPLGRIESVVSAGGDDLLKEYDNDANNICAITPAPRVTLSTNGLGQERVEVKNAMGESVAVYDDNCGMVSYEYDAIGNLTNVIGADGVVVGMSYDLAGRKIDMIDPDKGIWQYAYNTLGEMTRQLDSKGQVIDFSYDDLGRVTERFELKEVTSLTDSSPTLVNTEISSYRTASPGMGQPLSVTYQDSSGVDLHKKEFFYDAYGRVDIVSTSIGAETFAEQTTYDEYSRVFQQFDSSGADHGLRYVYTNGYLSQLKEARDGASGTVYQDIQAMDARGNVTNMTLGGPASGGYTAIIDASYEQSSGRLLNLPAYDGNGTEIQDVDYFFDVLGNLKQRHDQSGLTTNLNETFFYDNLNRLEAVNLSLDGAAAATTMSLTYDASGNIMSKSGVGTYLYDASRPHAVSNAGGIEYDYDANGNQISGDGRTITYTVFDKPDSITKDGDQVDFAYGVGNSRYQRIDSGPTLQRTTLYLGSVERITEGSSTYYKRYLGGVAIATYYPSTDTQNIAYLLKDHIGSIHTVLDEDAAITARMHFGAFGERQDMNWQSAFTGYQYALNAITTRGFTGHEQVDSMGIVHMNGRIYDPKLGRFLQADSFVQSPKNSQSLNRYTYVLNNPLSYIDPSGYFSFKKWARVIAAITITVYTAGALSGAAWAGALGTFAGGLQGLNAYAFAAGGGFLAGGVSTGTLKGAFIGAFTAVASLGIANHLSGGQALFGNAAVGGAGSELGGGRFGHGFLSAGFTASMGGPISKIGGDFAEFKQAVAAAIVGGTASEISGGKFKNGAVSSALQYAISGTASTGGKTCKSPCNGEVSVDESQIRSTDDLRLVQGHLTKLVGDSNVNQLSLATVQNNIAFAITPLDVNWGVSAAYDSGIDTLAAGAVAIPMAAGLATPLLPGIVSTLGSNAQVTCLILSFCNFGTTVAGNVFWKPTISVVHRINQSQSFRTAHQTYIRARQYLKHLPIEK